MEDHEVAVTVFATVPGVNPGDAANRLERLVMNRMLWNGKGFTLPSSAGVTTADVPVHTVIEAGAAIADGYLRSTVTNKAMRQSSHD